MIVSIWVFFMLGDPTPAEPGIAYVQATASPWQHDHRPEAVETMCQQEFAACFPGHCVTECGWKRQEVKVMGE
jgi:hypothetical protein